MDISPTTKTTIRDLQIEREIIRMSLGRNVKPDKNNTVRDIWVDLNGLWWRSILLNAETKNRIQEYARFKSAIHDDDAIWDAYAKEAESIYGIGGILDAYAAGVSIDDITA